ncbi:hypothetical protein ABPG72_016619 [Tetrahymena utriculariae]
MSDTEGVQQETQLYVSPIANPIAPAKLEKKILKLTKKQVKTKNIKRGVKEVVKAIRKGATGVCIMAADISPPDVLSHIPVICENKDIPYAFVKSRMELGTAAETKKPTSVVLLTAPENAKTLKKYNSIHEKVKSINPYF